MVLICPLGALLQEVTVGITTTRVPCCVPEGSAVLAKGRESLPKAVPATSISAEAVTS